MISFLYSPIHPPLPHSSTQHSSMYVCPQPLFIQHSFTHPSIHLPNIHLTLLPLFMSPTSIHSTSIHPPSHLPTHWSIDLCFRSSIHPLSPCVIYLCFTFILTLPTALDIHLLIHSISINLAISPFNIYPLIHMSTYPTTHPSIHQPK